MPMRRRRGLIGMAATTAVVAGTATAVSGRVAQKQYNKQAAAQAQAAPAPAPVAAAPPPPPPEAESGGGDLVGELQNLSQLHNAGVLSDEEFAAAKAKLLG